MKYSKQLRKTFAGIKLDVEDLFLLESFQISYLPERVPRKEFAELLHSNPIVYRFLLSKYPPIRNFIETLLKKHKAINNLNAIEENYHEVLWEIADLIVYNKYPELYDEKVELAWDINEVIPIKSLQGKTVVDAGAGTGLLAFQACEFASTVFAVEPVGSFRNFIKDKANRLNLKNIYTIDGVLDSIPLPEKSVDILMTSNALGWNLEAELNEIERVVKPGGKAIHLFRDKNSNTENPFHDILTSKEWGYTCTKFDNISGLKMKYHKTIQMH